MRVFLAIALGVLVLGVRAEAKPKRYELRERQIEVTRPGYTSYGSDLSLFDGATRRVLWKRRVADLYKPFWSRDGRAMAAVCRVAGGDLRVLVWRVGQRLREFDFTNVDDYIMECAWSPDNRRLLIFSGSSGNEMFHHGSLTCLKLGPWPRYKQSPVGGSQVRAYRWKSRRTVAYWLAHPRGITALKKPLLWHAP